MKNLCICRGFYFQILHIEIYDQLDRYNRGWWAFDNIYISVHHREDTDVYIFNNSMATKYHLGSVQRYSPHGMSCFNDNPHVVLIYVRSLL